MTARKKATKKTTASAGAAKKAGKRAEAGSETKVAKKPAAAAKKATAAGADTAKTVKAAKAATRSAGLRIAFFGGREPGVSWLEALSEAGYSPSLIVDRPPREREGSTGSRTSVLAPWAKEHGVELLAGARARDAAVVERLKALDCNLGIVGGYGCALAEEVIAAPRLGFIGVHGSLLPRYRGGNPVRAALLEGEKETGVTVYRLTSPDKEEEGNDLGGPILLQEPLAIEDRETYGELIERVAEVGSTLLLEAVAALERGRPKLKGKQQDAKRVSEAIDVTTRHRQAPWWLPASGVFQRLRAFAPDEGLTSMLKRRGIEILWGVPIEWESAPFGVTGTYLGLRQGRMAVLCGDGTVFGIDRVRWIDDEEIQSSFDFVYAEKVRPGERFA